MHTRLSSFLFAASTTIGAAVAQAAAVAPKAPAPRAVDARVEQRSFALRFVGRELTNRGPLHARLGVLLTPNHGSFEYSADRQELVVRDTPTALDAIANEIARADVASPQVLLDVRLVRVSSPHMSQLLVADAEPAARQVAILDDRQTAAVTSLLRRENASVTQAPRLIALPDQIASIFVGKQPAPTRMRDGGVASPLDADALDIAIVPSIEADHRIALKIDLRSQLTSSDCSTFSLPLVVASGQTAVFEKFAAADRGAIVLVTATILRTEPTPARR